MANEKHKGREPLAERRQLFTCRVSPSTAEFMKTLPGSNGQRVDQIVAILRSIQAMLPKGLRE